MKRVELIDVSKSYDKQVNVISNINVTIEPGEFFVLVGPSGCGKSTMLRMIAGLEEITGGTLKIGDKVANNLTPDKRDLIDGLPKLCPLSAFVSPAKHHVRPRREKDEERGATEKGNRSGGNAWLDRLS